MELKYKRIILKVSGEALSGNIGHGINAEIVTKISNVIKNINELRQIKPLAQEASLFESPI